MWANNLNYVSKQNKSAGQIWPNEKKIFFCIFYNYFVVNYKKEFFDPVIPNGKQ